MATKIKRLKARAVDQERKERIIEHKKLAKAFAKAMAQQTIHDPDGKTSRRQSRTYSSLTRETVEGYLASPTSNEKNLRDASIFLYQVNSRYRNLLQYYANIPCWVYTISALNYNPDKIKVDNFKKQYQKVCNILESMGIVKHMREAVLTALREGAYYGVIWGGDGNVFILQKLNADHCTIVSVSDGGAFQFAYDMSQIKESDLPTYYPPQFSDMYLRYKNGGSQYQTVPAEISFCIKADPTVPDYSIPPFSAILPNLYYIKNIEDLTEAATELSNYKMIAGKIPVDDEGVPLVDYPTVMQYYNHIAGNVGDRVGVALSPFELKSYDFEKSGATAQIDNVARANENFFSAAGSPAPLHGASDAASGVTKLSVKVDESISFALMYQCEKVVNRFLKTLSGTQKFKINFLPVSIYNRDEMLSKYKEALNYGMCKLQYLATLGVSQYDVLNQNFIEDEILNIDNILTPLRTSSTQSSDGNTAGRPEATDAEISDAGERTRDSDANDNR